MATLVVGFGCADEEPQFGGAGAIKNVEVFEQAPVAVVEGGAGATPRQLFTPVWTALNGPCGCHTPPGTSNAPVFFGNNEQASYDAFKANNYHLEGGKPPGSAASTKGLVEKGPHLGRALNAEEKALIATWRAAEKASGPTDAGGGG